MQIAFHQSLWAMRDFSHGGRILPMDVNNNTAQLPCRVILDALGTLVVEGKLGHRAKVLAKE